MHTFVLDIGKTNLKCHVLDEEGHSLWSVSQSNRTVERGPYPHFDVDGIQRWLEEALRQAAEHYTIAAINISTHGACAVLLDAQGEVLLPVMDYEYQGLDEADDGYDQIRPPFSETFSPRLPAGLNLGRQLWWLRHRFSDRFAQLHTLLMYPQFWASRLCGQQVMERTSLGCHTDLWNPARDDFSDLVDTLGIQSALPPLVDNWQPIGHVTAELAARTGLSQQCRVFAGVHDSNASLSSHLFNLPNDPFTVVSTGTWIITMAIGSDTRSLQEERDMLANVSVTRQPVACARFMGGREFETICQKTGANLSDPVDINHIARLLHDKVYALPDFADGSGPFPQQRGKLVGHVPQNHGKALATLYTALMIDVELDLLESSGDIVFGSSAQKNPLLCQLIAQLRPSQRVLLSGDQTSTVTGTWALTRWDHPHPPQTPYKLAQATQLGELAKYQQAWRALIEFDA